MSHSTKLLFICFLITSVSIVLVGTPNVQALSDSAKVTDTAYAFTRIMELTNLAAELASEESLKGEISPQQLKEYLTEIEGIAEECTGLYRSALANMLTAAVPHLGTINEGVKLSLRTRIKVQKIHQQTASDRDTMKRIQNSAKSINPNAKDAAQKIMKLGNDMRTLALHAEEALQEIKTCPLYSQ